MDKIEPTISALETELQEIVAQIGGIGDNAGAIELARTFVQLRSVVDRLEEITKPVKDLYNKMKVERLPQVFDREGVPSVNLDEGYRVTISHKVFASIRPDKKEKAYEWLRDNKLGDLIVETVNSSTLSAAAKSMAEDNYELDQELFNVSILPNTSVTKTKKG